MYLRRLSSETWALSLVAWFAAAATLGQQPELAAPLPEVRPFLQEVRRHLRSDEALLAQYTFTEKHTEHRLNGRGAVTKTTAEVYEVYPSFDRGRTYRKLIARDGRPVPARELALLDQKQNAEIEKEARRLASEDAAAREKRESEQREKEDAVAAEVFRVYDITIVGRETLDGRSTIELAFGPRADAKPASKVGKIMKKFRGRAWVDEADHQVVRVESELVDTLSFGFGIIARLKPGARVSFERRKVNGEIWLPAVAHFTGSARLLLVKGLSIDAISEYSDYKKFSVDTSVDYSPEKSPD